MMSDEQLVQDVLRGDNQAYEDLVLKHQHKIFTLAYRCMGDEDDAYAMAQEAMIKAYRSLHSFKGRSSFSTWLYRITINVCLDEIRRRKRRIIPFSLNQLLAAADGDEVQKDIVDESLAADQLYEQKELFLYIQQALNELRPEYRMAIVLRDMMGLSYHEIAIVFNCNLGTVKSRINRARSEMKKKLNERELLS